MWVFTSTLVACTNFVGPGWLLLVQTERMFHFLPENLQFKFVARSVPSYQPPLNQSHSCIRVLVSTTRTCSLLLFYNSNDSIYEECSMNKCTEKLDTYQATIHTVMRNPCNVRACMYNSHTKLNTIQIATNVVHISLLLNIHLITSVSGFEYIHNQSEC